MEKSLEEIFWKDGKFQNKNGKKVNPKPIGEPKLVELVGDFDKEKRINFEINLLLLLLGDKSANVFSKGKEYFYERGGLPFSERNTFHRYPIQFYKI